MLYGKEVVSQLNFHRFIDTKEEPEPGGRTEGRAFVKRLRNGPVWSPGVIGRLGSALVYFPAHTTNVAHLEYIIDVIKFQR